MQPRPDAVRSFVIDHPVVPLSLRSALAATLAWLAVMPFGGIADEYPYYAPLGAVVAVSTSVNASIRSAAQALLAVGSGAALGVALHATTVPRPIGIAVVVALGTLLGTGRWFGTLGAWVPISALFVLVLGQDDPWYLGLGYLALTGVGALVGSLVSLALPPLLLAETARAQDLLRTELVDQLDDLADGLDGEELPTAEQWRARRFDVEPRAREVREMVARATEYPRLNWRVRRWQHRADELAVQGRALANLAFQVGDLADLIELREHADRGDRDLPLGPGLRPSAADALRTAATALRTVQGSAAEPRALAEALRAVDELTRQIRLLRQRTGEDLFVAGTLATNLRSELLSVEPEPGAE